MKRLITILDILVITLVLFLAAHNISGQTDKLGDIKYTPPIGMAKASKNNVVAFSELNEVTGKFCIITLYGATPGTGSPQGDFEREWTNLVISNMKAEKMPTADQNSADGWTVLAGGSSVDSEAGKAVAFLTVISGFGRTVSVLAVFNDPSYVKKIETFISVLDIDKPKVEDSSTRAVSTAPLTYDVDGHIIMPEPKASFTMVDITGVWEEGGRISTSYVFRATGAHAGTDSVAFKIKRTITPQGSFSSDFFEIRNGKTNRDITTGTISVSGRLLLVKEKNRTVKYVIRGWLELPNMTILRLAEGPWQDDDPIPENRFTDFSDFSRFFPKTHWVRMR